MINFLKEHLYHKPLGKLIHLLRWLKKCNDYSEVLWDDYDWDYGGTLRLLDYKLKRLREAIIKNNLLPRSEIRKISKQIITARTYIKVILDGWSPEQQSIENQLRYKWGKRLHRGYDWSGGWVRSKVTKDNLEEFRKDESAKIVESMKLEVQQWNRLFDYLKEHMNYWWD